MTGGGGKLSSINGFSTGLEAFCELTSVCVFSLIKVRYCPIVRSFSASSSSDSDDSDDDSQDKKDSDDDESDMDESEKEDLFDKLSTKDSNFYKKPPSNVSEILKTIKQVKTQPSILDLSELQLPSLNFDKKEITHHGGFGFTFY